MKLIAILKPVVLTAVSSKFIFLETLVLATMLLFTNSQALDFSCENIIYGFNGTHYNVSYVNCPEQPKLINITNATYTNITTYNITNCTETEIIDTFKEYFNNYSNVIQENFNYSRLWLDCKESREVCIREAGNIIAEYKELNSTYSNLKQHWDLNVSRTINETRKENEIALRDMDNTGWLRAGVGILAVLGIWSITKVKFPRRTERVPISATGVSADTKAINRDAELAQMKANVDILLEELKELKGRKKKK